jgi:hypothetical protein
MHKKTLFEFQEAVTNRVANDYADGRHQEGEIPQDLLWDWLEKFRWPVDKKETDPELRLYFSVLSEMVEAKIARLRAVDPQG